MGGLFQQSYTANVLFVALSLGGSYPDTHRGFCFCYLFVVNPLILEMFSIQFILLPDFTPPLLLPLHSFATITLYPH
jgi:hypothetical protein